MAYRVAVAGATGKVGREMMSILDERRFPADEIVPLASARSAGSEVKYGSGSLTCQDLDQYSFAGTDIALFAVGSEATERHAPRAAESGSIVIDNSSLYRYCEDVPLVVPEVNPQDVSAYRQRNIVANPNCSTAQMVVALKPLHDRAGIQRVVVSTYQSVSGAGKELMDTLSEQSREVLNGDRPRGGKGRYAFNVVPHIDRFLDDGSTREEWKMQAETKRILDPAIEICATCVRVPVFIGHAESINVQFAHPLPVEEAVELLEAAPGVEVVDHREEGGYATPLDCAGRDSVLVSRIRRDSTVENGIGLWCVSDNLRKGAALNAIQIAELLHRDCLACAEA